ncbi:MAG: 4-hydroxy-3-methylbut-2-enyl diphosphate reductase [Gemmatimonadota bacterium]|nr:4-hydroxy-3-methylbut-2-enyl diphosphate reductase [Gemmatimonadota bacterium]MDH3569102.1 4-hydroxy-3-methylbut-2-enyl diphosphate reductase [Gemmatimonadota bacterium]MDH5548306.1 4-hydroxy-3-methylbut-2-enyl diphosphate reductase [Gemmatimonadota bacterium]
MDQTYFRKGFGLKREIEGHLATDYHSRLVDRIRESDFTIAVNGLTIRLAQEFGFCYGVDRAVEYAYESREKFPDRRIFLVGEIIHNPHVNEKLETMGVTVLRPGDAGDFDLSAVEPEDVVLIPAFGVRVSDFDRLRDIGCVLVDTTCGSVLNVWKRVESYARDGYTAIVHGKHFHEETKATASQVTKYPDGRYLIVRDMNETELLCRYLRGEEAVDAVQATFGEKVSTGFVFERDLQRVGLANQTTMLASESLEIAMRIGHAMADRYGQENLADHFRSFGTICSATQERQDAILALIEEPLDVMVVVGGYNSSNTSNLARICARKVTTYHIADSSCIDPDTGAIRHKPVDAKDEVTTAEWLTSEVGRIGITAGASTPNNKIGAAIERILHTKGLSAPF